MLQKRANILFEEEMWQMLTALAKTEGVSVAELVRQAVRESYRKKSKELLRRKAIDDILRIRPKLKGPIDYKALIEDGRRY